MSRVVSCVVFFVVFVVYHTCYYCCGDGGGCVERRGVMLVSVVVLVEASCCGCCGCGCCCCGCGWPCVPVHKLWFDHLVGNKCGLNDYYYHHRYHLIRNTGKGGLDVNVQGRAGGSSKR